MASKKLSGTIRESAQVSRQRAESVRQAQARIFLQRSVRMLERLSQVASADALNAALSSPSDVGGVASFLSDMAPLGVDLSSVDPLAESLAQGVRIKQELLRETGGGLNTAQVASVLGMTRQGVDKRRIRGTILAVPIGSAEFIYPACQFTSEGLVPHLAEVLQSFQVRNPWTKLSVLLAPAPALGGRNPISALKDGDVKEVMAVAAAFGEQGG